MQHFQETPTQLDTIYQYSLALGAFFQHYLLFVELEIMMPTKSHHQVMPIHAEKRHTAIHT